MLKAIEFAKEIERKKKILETTTSHTLKRDTEKSIFRDRKELMCYCKTRGFDYHDVVDAAKAITEAKEIKKALTKLP